MGDMSGEYAGHGRAGTFSASRNYIQIGGSRVAQRPKCMSVQEASLQYLVQIQAVSHLAMIESPIGWRTIGPASSRFGRGRPSL
jgi:hypothetical protein